MKETASFFILIIILNLISCNTKKKLFYGPQPQKIKSISFENWNTGRRESGGGTLFIIELEKPLQNNIQLEKIYYQNLEARLVQVNETKFKAYFLYNTFLQDHQNSTIATHEFHLKNNEAVIEYNKNHQKYWYKCLQIKEIVPKEFP